MAKGLSDKQLMFIELWNGNATETAELCGYSNPKQAGSRLFKNVDICRRIQERRAAEIKPQVMSRIERQIFWTNTIKGKESDADFKDRLKASELLGRSEADFLDRTNLTGNIDIKIRWDE